MIPIPMGLKLPGFKPNAQGSSATNACCNSGEVYIYNDSTHEMTVGSQDGGSCCVSQKQKNKEQWENFFNVIAHHYGHIIASKAFREAPISVREGKKKQPPCSFILADPVWERVDILFKEALEENLERERNYEAYLAEKKGLLSYVAAGGQAIASAIGAVTGAAAGAAGSACGAAIDATGAFGKAAKEIIRELEKETNEAIDSIVQISIKVIKTVGNTITKPIGFVFNRTKGVLILTGDKAQNLTLKVGGFVKAFVESELKDIFSIKNPEVKTIVAEVVDNIDKEGLLQQDQEIEIRRRVIRVLVARGKEYTSDKRDEEFRKIAKGIKEKQILPLYVNEAGQIIDKENSMTIEDKKTILKAIKILEKHQQDKGKGKK